MRAAFISTVIGAVITTCAIAETPRPAPNVQWGGSKNASLRSFRGQPVILLIGPSPRYGAFRKQLDKISDNYRQISAQNAVVLAAFTQESGGVSSNVPVVIVPNGAGVASAFGADPARFTIAIVGKDGNIDLQTDKVQAGRRVADVLINAYPVQVEQRRH